MCIHYPTHNISAFFSVPVLELTPPTFAIPKMLTIVRLYGVICEHNFGVERLDQVPTVYKPRLNAFAFSESCLLHLSLYPISVSLDTPSHSSSLHPLNLYSLLHISSSRPSVLWPLHATLLPSTLTYIVTSDVVSIQLLTEMFLEPRPLPLLPKVEPVLALLPRVLQLPRVLLPRPPRILPYW